MKNFTTGLFAIVVGIILLILGTTILLAHSWFPAECCNYKEDCKEVTDWSLEGNYFLIKTIDGALLAVRKDFPIRPSQDKKKYICHLGPHVFCLFSPVEG